MDQYELRKRVLLPRSATYFPPISSAPRSSSHPCIQTTVMSDLSSGSGVDSPTELKDVSSCTSGFERSRSEEAEQSMVPSILYSEPIIEAHDEALQEGEAHTPERTPAEIQRRGSCDDEEEPFPEKESSADSFSSSSATALQLEEYLTFIKNRKLDPLPQLIKDSAAIMELINTERRYVEQLTVLIERYLLPIRTKKLMAKKLIKSIFGNVEELLPIHKRLLAELDTISALQAATAEHFVATFRRVFAQLNEALRREYSIYCRNYRDGLAKLSSLKKTESPNSKLSRFLIETQRLPQCHNLDLSSYLIMPVQRICRYHLLLEAIEKQEHVQLSDVIDATRMLADVANYSTGERENECKMKALEEEFVSGKKLHLVAGKKTLLHEGPATLMLNKGRRPAPLLVGGRRGAGGPAAAATTSDRVDTAKEVHAFLFNDSLVFAEARKASKQSKKRKHSMKVIYKIELKALQVRSMVESTNTHAVPAATVSSFSSPAPPSSTTSSTSLSSSSLSSKAGTAYYTLELANLDKGHVAVMQLASDDERLKWKCAIDDALRKYRMQLVSFKEPEAAPNPCNARGLLRSVSTIALMTEWRQAAAAEGSKQGVLPGRLASSGIL